MPGQGDVTVRFAQPLNTNIKGIMSAMVMIDQSKRSSCRNPERLPTLSESAVQIITPFRFLSIPNGIQSLWDLGAVTDWWTG